MGFCTCHRHGERTSIGVWCSHSGAPACEIKSGHAVDCQQCWNPPGGKKSQKTAQRISLSLDNLGPHKCSAMSLLLTSATWQIRRPQEPCSMEHRENVDFIFAYHIDNA